MIKKKFHFWLVFVVLAASACDDSSSNDEPGKKDTGTASDEDAMVPDASPGKDDKPDGSVSDEDAATVMPSLELCGNGKVDTVEECDDGDLQERNGCTPLCTFSCKTNEDCDDGNDCNGVETCGTDENEHACNDDVEPLDDGESCGEDKSCWQDVCVANICGDGKPTGNEKCDDGNRDPDDGCTTDCEYSCESDDDCEGSDECLGNRKCKDHACVGGDTLDDKEACTIVDAKTKSLCGDSDVDKDGWCMAGRCTCTDCGDGDRNGIEECDDGELNGTDDSPNHCSVNCQVVACGNAAVEGDEECDDGNKYRLDGCDPDCKYEFAHRFTAMTISKDDTSPDWCVHENNRFREAFGSEQSIMGMKINILNVVNQQLSGRMTQGTNNYIFQVMDSEDTSMKTADDDITIAAYQGNPSGTKNIDQINELDFPFIIQASQVDPDTRMPAEHHSARAEQTGGGKIISKEAATLEMVGLRGTFNMYDFKTLLVFDTSTASAPAPSKRLKISEDLKLPEYSGEDGQGMFCGAMDQGATDEPIVNGNLNEMQSGSSYGPTASMCCKNRGSGKGTKYTACENGVLTDACDSIADLIQQGCTVCLDISAGFNPQTIAQGSNCDFMESAPSNCFAIIQGIEFDVDQDGDGENDTWSVLFNFKGMRTRLYDVAEE